MNGASEDFLAGAALPGDEDGAIGKPRYLNDLAEHSRPGRALTHQVVPHHARVKDLLHFCPALQPGGHLLGGMGGGMY